MRSWISWIGDQYFRCWDKNTCLVALLVVACFSWLQGQTPYFGEDSANLNNRYLSWQEGTVLNYDGYGLVNGVTVKTTVGGVEVVDGISCRVVITDRSNDYLQHFWLAQDDLGNVWQLRNLDALTGEYHEEDVLYMPTYPKQYESYDLWDITYATSYFVDGTKTQETVPAGTFQNCVLFSTVDDGIPEREYFAPLVGLIRSEARSTETTPRSGYALSSIENHNPPELPFVSRQPRSQDVIYGTTVVVGMHLVSTEPAVYQWYEGESGNSAVPLSGQGDATLDTGLIHENKQFWVRAWLGSQTFDSETAVLTVIPEKVGPKLYGLGSNAWGQFGLGHTMDPPPTNLIRSGGVLAASAGSAHSLFITLDGTLWGMGINDRGQLGQWPFTNFFSTPLILDTDVIQAEAGPEYNLYLKSDNSLWGFGRNDFGQLGTGDIEWVEDPVMIDTDVIAMSPSQHPDRAFTLYLKSDGTLMGMGRNQNGNLGTGPGYQHLSPVVIDTDVSRISAANFHSHYIKKDGRLFAMGWNQFGQLGDGTFENRDIPVLVDTEVAQVSGGNNQSFYVKTNGELYAMGSNIPGQGPKTETPVLYDTGVTYVDSGGWYKKTGTDIYSLANKTMVLTGVLSFSIGGHVLYLTDNDFELINVPASIRQDDPEEYHIFSDKVTLDAPENYLLYSSDDLDNWTIFSIQNKTVQESELIFRLPRVSISSPHFFQVRGTGP